MYGSVVQRIFGSGDTEKAGTLLKGFGTHAWDFHQFFP
jgi:hypothetical protein